MALVVRLCIILVISCDMSYFQRRFYYKLDGKQQMEQIPSLRNKNITRTVVNLDRWLLIKDITAKTLDESETANVYIRHFDGLKEVNHECRNTEPYDYACLTVGRFAVVESKSTLLEVTPSTLNIYAEGYIGCFKNQSTSEIKKRRTGAGGCRLLCGTFFGLNSNCDCVCVQSLNELIQVDLSLCTKYCANFEICGKDDYLAIYWKDCAVDNGNCGDSECRSIFMWKFFPFKHCFCASGFQVGPTQCEDIDECANSSNLCDASSTKCVNSQGSYTCEALQEREKDQEKEQEKEHDKEREKETDQEKDPKAEMNLVYTGAGFAAVALLFIVILYIYFKKKGAKKE